MQGRVHIWTPSCLTSQDQGAPQLCPPPEPISTPGPPTGSAVPQESWAATPLLGAPLLWEAHCMWYAWALLLLCTGHSLPDPSVSPAPVSHHPVRFLCCCLFPFAGISLCLFGHFPISPLEHKCLKCRNLAVKFAAAIPGPGTMPGME